MPDSTTQTLLLRWGAITPHEVASAPSVRRALSIPPNFPYVRKALTLAEFAHYVDGYQFGTIPPDYVVLHHTALPNFTQWTADEDLLDDTQRRNKRLRYLDAIKTYYNETLGWSSGPHLFIDDAWIFLMTPMYDPGTHAAAGNQTTLGGRLHYSIGIEVVGDYTKQAWPAPIAHNVANAIALLQKRLGTFAIKEQRGPGGISRHADYNKPACPGATITPAYYLPLIRAARATLDIQPPISRVTAGPHGAMLQQDYVASAAAVAYYPPGTVIDITVNWLRNGYYHKRDGQGFVPVGHVEHG